MAKASSGERRKQILKQRRAEEQREADIEEAGFLFQDAMDAQREGDAPAADRLLKKALILHPEHAPALTLLAQIHDSAGHFAEALGYLQRLRKLSHDPTVIYNIGVIYNEMGQPENAVAAMREFLAVTAELHLPKWQQLRASADSLCRFTRLPAPQEHAPAPTPPKPPLARKESPRPQKDEAPDVPEPPHASVQFLPAAMPAFTQVGSLADYFLRRQWIELRLAQNFEDLLCLPSLEGVDAYIYQQETVRKVLRHFKGRALLADEVGLGKDHRSLPGAEGVLDARPGAQGAGADSAVAGFAMER